MVQNREKITNALRRNIKSGSNYGKYIPASDCSSVFLGTGKTDFAVQSMKKWALKYVHHTQNLAPLFKDGNLIDICYKIKNFAYSHFQYKLDGHTQQIKSPACSWATRYDGIDCKNYSIFVSTLLQNLNITHYFRRIKQPNYLPLHFTHVYVVVPVNQKDISDGYYVIDGIIGGFQEVSYIEKDDVLVYLKKQKNAKNAKIVQLGAVANQPNQASYVEQLTLTDINALVDGISKREQALMQTLKQRDIATVTGTIGIVGGVAGVVGLIPVAAPVAKVIELTAFVVGAVSKILMTMFYDPCAGAEYTATGVGERIKAELEPKLDKELKYIHSCVNDGTISGAESFINTILKEIDLGYAHYFHEVSVHRGNPCSVQA